MLINNTIEQYHGNQFEIYTNKLNKSEIKNERF